MPSPALPRRLNGRYEAEGVAPSRGRGHHRPVAATLGFNKRTLQSRLVDEGLVFTALLNDTRRELCLRYVTNESLALSHVAGLVGYARQSSFNRWFAGEFGASPTRWRQSGTAGEPSR